MNGISKIAVLSILLLAAVVGLSFTTASAAPKAQNTCSDTDGGNVITVFGTVSGLYKNKPYSYGDSCVNAATIKEYYCNGVYQTSSQQSCGTDGYSGSDYCASDDVYRDWKDYYCASGACGSSTTPILQQDCGTDGYIGSNYCLNGSVYRDWRDAYCSSGACGYTDTPTLQQACEWGCTGATCNPHPDTCSDTDGGNVITVSGATYGYLNENPYSHNDTCSDASSIMEYYCSGNYEQSSQQSCGTDGYMGSPYCMGFAVFQNYTDYYCNAGACGSSTWPSFQQNCTYGCSNGACNQPPADSCSDTDGGYEFGIQGTVSGYYGGSPYEYTDTCVDNVTLSEWTCYGTQAHNIPNYPCAGNFTTSCLDGACV